MRRKGGRGKCAACDHAEAAAINRALVTGTSLSKVSKQYGITGPALSAHRRNHLSPALAVVRTERLAKGATTVMEEVTALVAHMKTILAQAVKAKNAGQAMAANRELRGDLELLARITGELDTRTQVVLNIATSPDWIRTRTALMEALIPFPEATRAAADALAKVAAA
jgi:hypothetical protein